MRERGVNVDEELMRLQPEPRLACPASLAQLSCAGTHTVAGQDEVTNPQAQGRLILLVVELGCLCGGADLAELTRVSPEIHGSYHQSV